MSIHAILDLENPVNEVVLFTLEIPCVLRVLDGTEDAKHTRGCPAVT